MPDQTAEPVCRGWLVGGYPFVTAPDGDALPYPRVVTEHNVLARAYLAQREEYERLLLLGSEAATEINAWRARAEAAEARCAAIRRAALEEVAKWCEDRSDAPFVKLETSKHYLNVAAHCRRLAEEK